VKSRVQFYHMTRTTSAGRSVRLDGSPTQFHSPRNLKCRPENPEEASTYPLNTRNHLRYRVKWQQSRINETSL